MPKASAMTTTGAIPRVPSGRSRTRRGRMTSRRPPVKIRQPEVEVTAMSTIPQTKSLHRFPEIWNQINPAGSEQGTISRMTKMEHLEWNPYAFRFSGNFGHAPLVVRKSRSRERPIGGFPGNKPLTPGNRIPSSPESSQQQQIKDRERELERIHRRSRELMLSPRLMDVSAVNSSRDSSVDRQSTLSNR